MLLLLVACSQRLEPDDTEVVTPTDEPEDTAPIDTDVDTDADTGSDEPIGLCINELMPDNEAAVADETGARPDWIELHNPTDAAIALEGWYITDYRLEPGRHRLGALTLDPGDFLVLWADELPDLGPDHLGFALSNEGGEVALFAPDGRGTIVTYGPMAADFSLARAPDCCEGEGCLTYDFRGSPAASNVDPVYEDVPIVAAGGRWKYWDQGTNPGADWATLAYVDATWPSGDAPLGYGDPHILTSVGSGPDPNNKYITTWFRYTFDVPARAFDSLTLSLLRDDGAVVYLNGVEVARDNLPTDVVTDTTLALASVPTGDETTYFSYALDPAALLPGTNVLAVEVHQAAATSSDLGFDAALTGQVLVTGE